MSTSSLARVPIRDADAVDSLWDLLASPTIDPAALARAIERVLVRPELDWRTLQLLKEGWQALEHFADWSSLQLDEYLLNQKLLHALSARYGLHITHFQGHYLPRGWESRTTDFGMFGKIHVNLVDPLDIIAGKVSSSRPKDPDDFRLLSLSLDKEQLRQRVTQGMAPHGSNEKDRQQAIQNWYIVYGDDLEFRS
jgi:hypothetical protein